MGAEVERSINFDRSDSISSIVRLYTCKARWNTDDGWWYHHCKFVWRSRTTRIASRCSSQVDPKKPQQDENWLFGRIGNGQEGFFPAAYAEQITYVHQRRASIRKLFPSRSASTPAIVPQIDTTSILPVREQDESLSLHRTLFFFFSRLIPGWSPWPIVKANQRINIYRFKREIWFSSRSKRMRPGTVDNFVEK